MPNYKKIRLQNGMELPPIGYGTFPYKEELRQSIPFAIQTGYRLIDTSDDYQNYAFVGEGVQASTPNDDIIIEGKISLPYKPEEIRSLVINYKRQLNLENKPLDVLLLHFPYPHIFTDSWHEMEKLYDDGLCRAIGVCNFEITHLEKLMKACRIKPMINQFELHPMFRQKELCEYCEKQGIAIMSYSPLARMNKNLFTSEIIQGLAEKHNKEIAQIILRWNIQHGYIPIPASAKENHIVSNYEVFDFELSDSDMEKIDGLDCGMRIRKNPNTMFHVRTKVKLFAYHLDYIKKRIIIRRSNE